MKKYGPLQLADANGKPSGKYRYCMSGSNGAGAIGYCAPFIEPVSIKDGGFYGNQEDIDKTNQFKDKHHAEPHSSYEEACACYKEYELDHHLRHTLETNIKNPVALYKCEVEGCNSFTCGYAQVGGYHTYKLCDEHNNRETVEKLYSVGESFQS